jgi:hypothetical protein
LEGVARLEKGNTGIAAGEIHILDCLISGASQ